ncbi:MAG: tetratricopeptide repeat protein, partial [Nitrospiria bacterium]
YPRVHYNLGLLALRRGNPEDAASAFTRAATFNPSDAGARAHLGLLALRRGDAADAEAEFQRALSIDPSQRDSLNNLGTLYMEHREWARALALFTRALEKEPFFLEAAYNRAVALSALHRDDEARDALRVVRSRLPPEERFDPYRKGVDHLLAGGRP